MSTNPKLKKYADKIRTIAQECEGPDKKPDKYLISIADAVENNQYQLSAAIEGLIQTRKEFVLMQRAIVSDIMSLQQTLQQIVTDYQENTKQMEATANSINAHTAFHQNLTDLLIAYFGIPKQNSETDSTEPQKPPTATEEEELPPIANIEHPIEEPETWPPEEDTTIVAEETKKPVAEVIPEVVEDKVPEGVNEFKPKGKKNDKTK